eukprot:191000_1
MTSTVFLFAFYVICSQSIEAEVNLTWIFKCNNSIGYTHMPTIEWIPTSKTIVSAWQATKEKEGTNDQHIMFSYSTDMGNKWSTPQTIAYGDRYQQAVWGPALHWDSHNELLWLFYSESTPAQKNGDKSGVGGNILYKTSIDSGKTWSNFTEILSFMDYGNTSKMTANKPIVISLKNNTKRWILPIWQEGNSTAPKAARVMISDDFGIHWNVFGFVANHECIENTLASIKDTNMNDTGNILMICRSGGSPLYQSWSYDFGETWSKSNKSNVENPSSKIFMFTDSFGQQILANDASSSNRYPLVLYKSIDNGISFEKYVTLDSIHEDLAYPTSVQVPNANVNENPLVYTDFSADTHNGIKLAITTIPSV